jgi:hypothetical protein
VLDLDATNNKCNLLSSLKARLESTVLAPSSYFPHPTRAPRSCSAPFTRINPDPEGPHDCLRPGYQHPDTFDPDAFPEGTTFSMRTVAKLLNDPSSFPVLDDPRSVANAELGREVIDELGAIVPYMPRNDYWMPMATECIDALRTVEDDEEGHR